MCISMTTLLTHTLAHSTKRSFMPKTNNHPPKNVLSLALSCKKVVKNGKILTFKVNFLCQKLSELSKMTFAQLKARLKTFLNGWLLILVLKECLVECATLCVKSEVQTMLYDNLNYFKILKNQ